MIAVAALARSFKEAQNLLTPVYLICIMPAILAQVSTMELTYATALIPVGNIALLAREFITGRFSPGIVSLALLSTLFYAAIAINIAARIYNSERLLFAAELRSRRRAEKNRRQSPAPIEASVLLLGVMILFLLFGRGLQSRHLISGILVTEWILIGLPVLLLIWFGSLDLRACLHLRPTTSFVILGAALAGLSGWYVVSVLVESLQQRILPLPKEMIEEMQRALFSSERSLVVDLFAFALSPAICEELLFRGVLLRASRSTLSTPMALFLNAFLFGLFHLSIYRFFSTFFLGLALAFLVIRSGSILPAMLFHFLNNATTLTVGRYFGASELPSEKGFLGEGMLWAALALAIFAGGMFLAGGKQAPPDDSD
jgi:sodium transport system permease protein